MYVRMDNLYHSNEPVLQEAALGELLYENYVFQVALYESDSVIFLETLKIA